MTPAQQISGYRTLRIDYLIVWIMPYFILIYSLFHFEVLCRLGVWTPVTDFFLWTCRVSAAGWMPESSDGNMWHWGHGWATALNGGRHSKWKWKWNMVWEPLIASRLYYTLTWPHSADNASESGDYFAFTKHNVSSVMFWNIYFFRSLLRYIDSSMSEIVKWHVLQCD